MNLTPMTMLTDLIGSYPFLKEFIAKYGQMPAGLGDPATGATPLSKVSLQQLAQQSKVPLTQLLSALKDAIKAGSGDEIVIESQPAITQALRQE